MAVGKSVFGDALSGVMVSMLVSNAVDHEFNPWSGQTKGL